MKDRVCRGGGLQRADIGGWADAIHHPQAEPPLARPFRRPPPELPDGHDLEVASAPGTSGGPQGGAPGGVELERPSGVGSYGFLDPADLAAIPLARGSRDRRQVRLELPHERLGLLSGPGIPQQSLEHHQT